MRFTAWSGLTRMPAAAHFPGFRRGVRRAGAPWRQSRPLGAQHISARLVKFTLGALGPCPQIGTRFPQCRGARLGGGLDAGQLGAVLAVPVDELCLSGPDTGIPGPRIVTAPSHL